MERHSVILIPSLSPEDSLVTYIQELMAEGFQHILIVNDGSQKQYDPIFAKLEEMGCCVLKHAVNYGKGRALKNGFNEFLNRFRDSDNISGIITADSDGQHLVKDVIKLDERMGAAGKDSCRLLLGVRDFGRDDVPFKSRFGNRMTCFFFRLLNGKKISDTQTGLRGITTACLPYFLALKGERFEYETSMLIAAVKNKIDIEEITIETVYMDNNSGTHFRPLQDSMIIYGILFGSFLKYMLSSLSASIIDIGLFHIIMMFLSGTSGIWIATVAARIVSSLYNFIVNRKVVFGSNEKVRTSLYRYYLLCLLQGMCSAALVSLASGIVGGAETVCKIFVDTLLFFISFQIQRMFVF